jgi:Domain of unknown function (DUF3291)
MPQGSADSALRYGLCATIRESFLGLGGGELNYHLAQINVGRLVAPLDDPQIAEFVAGLEPINALADRAPGFVWRLQSAAGNATDIAYNDDPFVIVNMSVWESIAALRDFVYRSDHVRFFRDRAKWFAKLDKPIYCLWWVPVGHRPTVREGRERLEHYQMYGATQFSFWFSEQFPEPADQGVCA